MSFGFGLSDVLTLVQLAYTTFDGARKACGEHDDLTQEISSLVTVLDHVQSEISDPDSPINMARGRRRKELKNHIEGCRQHVGEINAILTNFNALSEEERGVGSFWQKVRFGNGAVKDIAQIRLKISTYTTAINISLTLLDLGSRGKAERQLSRQSGELRGIIESVNLLVAQLNANPHEASIWTKWTDDDVDFWRDFRRQLVKMGYKSRVVRSHKILIQAYMKELDSRGVLNEPKHLAPPSSAGSNSDSVISNLPELDAHQTDLEFNAQDQDAVSELSQEETDVLLHTPDHLSWDGENENEIQVEHFPQHDVSLHEEMSAFDQLQGEDSARTLDNVTYAKEKLWEVDDAYQVGEKNFSPSMSEMAQRLEGVEKLSRKQQELLQIMSGREDTVNEGVRVYKLLPPSASRHPMKLMARSALQSQNTKPELSYLRNPQSVAIDSLPVGDQVSENLVNLILDKEALARGRHEAFKVMSPEEKKVIITMQDSSGKKYPFLYFLVKTWEGMQYLVEQAFSNTEISHRVQKGEYDLVNIGDAVIIPHLWDTFVEPDMFVTMQMWPPPTPQMEPVSPEPPPPPPPPPPQPSTQPTPQPSPSLWISTPSITRRSPPVLVVAPTRPTRRPRTTSQRSSNEESISKTPQRPGIWSLFWSSSPSTKSKSTKSRRVSTNTVYNTYRPPVKCQCSECQFPRFYSQGWIPSPPSPPSPLPSNPPPPPPPSNVTSRFTARYPHITISKLELQKPKPGVIDHIESNAKVEPIFELDSEQIFELE